MVPSVEALSTTTTSRDTPSWARAAVRPAGPSVALLYVTTRALTSTPRILGLAGRGALETRPRRGLPADPLPGPLRDVRPARGRGAPAPGGTRRGRVAAGGRRTGPDGDV